MKTCGLSALPFSGLGVDLTPVLARGRLIEARWKGRSPEAPRSWTPATAPPRAHGYALLLGLSREIRGS